MTLKENKDHYETQIGILTESKLDVEKTIRSIEADFEGRIKEIEAGSNSADILENKESEIKGHLEYLKFLSERTQHFQDELSKIHS